MEASSRKHRSRRRVAALNFLSNISLDGTHRDTKYCIFQHKGIVKQGKSGLASAPCRNGGDKFMGPRCADAVHELVANAAGNAGLVEDLSLSEAADTGATAEPGSPLDTLALGSNIFSQHATALAEEESSSSKRTRACTYSGECPPCRRSRRRLYQTNSISEDASTDTELTFENLKLSVHPTRVRHKSTSSSASSVGSLSNQCEAGSIKSNVDKKKCTLRERVVLLSSSKVPFAIFSSLPYQKRRVLLPQRKDSLLADKRRSERQVSGNYASWEGFLGLGVFEREDGMDVSYSQLLVPSRSRTVKKMTSQEGLLQPISESTHSSPGYSCTRAPSLFRNLSHDPASRSNSLTDRESECGTSSLSGYNASLLDDPELRSGKHRTLLTFPSYMTSIVDYVKPSDLKKEVNEQFRERFPNIHLSLSKLRSLKRDLRKIGHIKCGLDQWTVAQCYVYFEKIIMKGLLNKPNRKLVAGACMLLSAKLNDIKGSDLTELIEEMEDGFKLHRRDLLTFEFALLVALEFSLHIPDSEIYPHYQRLMHMS